MAEAKTREEWNRLSCVLAMLVNTSANKDHKKPAAKPEEYNPYVAAERARKKKQAVLPEVGIEVLRDVFIDQTEALRR